LEPQIYNPEAVILVEKVDLWFRKDGTGQTLSLEDREPILAINR